MAVNLEAIKEALLTAQALYARVLGAKAQKETANQEAGERITAAKVALEKVAQKEAARLKELDAIVVEAEKELNEYQGKVKQELGIVIDLMAKPSGGSTRL